MSQENHCKYHSEIPAKWYCTGCKIALCSHCVMEERQTGQMTVCPACDKALRKLSTAHAIPPFWKRMPATFRYPLNGGSLSYLIGLALFSLLLLAPLWPVVVVAGLMLPLMVLRYGFSVLQHTAMGHLTAPKLSLNFQMQELALPLKLFAVIITLGFLMGLILFPFGVNPSAIELVAFVLNQLVLPAMVVLLAVHNSFFRAINPVDIGFVISTIGLPYLALCGVLLLLSSGPASVQLLLFGIIPLWLLTMFNVFIMGFFAIVTFHLLGYVVYQYHEQLGIKPEIDYDVKPAALKTGAPGAKVAENQGNASYPVLQKVRLLIKEGMQQAAKATLKKELMRHAETDNARIEMRQLYHQMLVNDKEHEAVLEHASAFIPELLESNQGKQALAIFNDCLELDPAFRLTLPADIHKLATAAQKADEHKIVVSLINGFMQKHPDYPDAIELLLMAARSLQHHFGQKEKAKQILRYIIKRYPEDERTQQARHNLMLIERPTGSAAA